jgi:hypothetical protein
LLAFQEFINVSILSKNVLVVSYYEVSLMLYFLFDFAATFISMINDHVFSRLEAFCWGRETMDCTNSLNGFQCSHDFWLWTGGLGLSDQHIRRPLLLTVAAILRPHRKRGIYVLFVNFLLTRPETIIYEQLKKLWL